MTTAKKKPGPKPGKKPGRPPKATPEATPEAAVLPLSVLDLSVCRAVRAGTDAEAAARYAERYRSKQPMPPVECAGVKGDPAAPVYVGDGGHRVAGSEAAGRSSIDALVHWCDTREAAEAKAWAIAYRGNAAHGLPRSAADLRAAVRAALLREPAASSDRAVAELLDCHRTTVMKVRCELTAAGELTGKASAEGRYKDGEYKDWVTGQGKRPTGKPAAPVSPEPGGRAATPPAPDWHGVGIADADLKPKVEKALEGLNVVTLGGLAAALELEGESGRLAAAGIGPADRRDLEEVIAAVKADGIVTADPPVVITGNPTPPAAPAPDVVRDEKGRPVPNALLPVFAARPRFRSFAQRVGELVREADDLAGHAAGAAVPLAACRQDAANLSKGVAAAMPYVVCPACSGTGKVKKGGCGVCADREGDTAGRGWLGRLRYDQLPPELRAACSEGDWGAGNADPV